MRLTRFLCGCFSFCNKSSVQKLIFGFLIGLILSEIYNFPYYKKIRHRSLYRNNSHVKIDYTQHNHSKTTLEKKLYDEVKILCWVMTHPDNHQIRVPYILRTWGKRCNKLLVISSKEDKELGIIGLPVRDGGRKYLWEKLKAGFKYVYDNYKDEYDWILKADDDTYVVVDNLRLLLYEYDPRTPIHFGFKFSAYIKQGYMSGGGGFAMTNEALIRFVEIAMPDPKKCDPTGLGAIDDVQIGKCLQNVGVIAGDSRDIDERGRFFIFSPEAHLLTEYINLNFWYWHYIYYKNFDGLNCCSDYAISFHYVSGKITDILHYFIYHVKPYGIKMLPRKLPDKKVYIQRGIPETPQTNFQPFKFFQNK